MNLLIQILVLIATLAGGCSGLKGLASKEYDLFNDLFKNYSKTIRPVASWEDVLQVNVKVQVNKIAKVLENHQTIKLYVRMEMSWHDVNLNWDASKYSDIKSLVVPAENIWIPEVHLFNSATEDDRIYPVNVELWSNGTITTAPINTLYAHCDFNFRRFPYDYQRCDFIIGTMLEKVNVKLHSFQAPVNKFYSNPEWKLLSISDGTLHTFLIPGTTHAKNEAFSYNWSASKFIVQISRDSRFYTNLFVWPMVFILVIGTGIFLLPPGCVERVSLGALLLLTLVISSLMLESFTPKSAEPSIISNLIAFDMFMITWSTVLSTLIISIDKENFLMVKKIPQWAKDAMLKYAGRLAFKQQTLKRVLNNHLLAGEDEIAMIETNRLVEAVGEGRADTEGTEADGQQEETVEVPETLQNKALLTLISNQLGLFRKQLHQTDVKDTNKREWYLIATVLDRVCLLVYGVISLFGLFVILI